MVLSIRSRDGSSPPVRAGRLQLSAETNWRVHASGPEGEAEMAALVEHLRGDLFECVDPRVGILRFGNAVGRYELPHLGPVEVHTTKGGELTFARMLSDISRAIAALPFAAGTGGAIPYDRTIGLDERVLYHAFVYLRHILSDAAPRDEQLLPSLRVVLADPQRVFERVRRNVSLHAARYVDPGSMVALVSGRTALHRAPAGVAVQLAASLRGHLPERVEESSVRGTFDVPENRFVKAFIEQAIGIIEQIREQASGRGRSFAARIETDCDRMLRLLEPFVRSGLLSGVGQMRRLPAESMVLQRRRGYREVFHHFLRMRMATRIPFDTDPSSLLEVKDIAALYELWCFFEVQRAITQALGAPSLAQAPVTTALQTYLPYDLRIEWPDGTELFYNLSFSRTNAQRRSYSLPLRPDIVLRTPAGILTLFDAKFRLRRIADVAPESQEPDDAELANERRGVFKHADLYKMHTYRDALEAPAVWILYPGDDFRFFRADQAAPALTDPTALPAPLEGVGAIPLDPTASSPPGSLTAVLETLLGTASSD
jgi:uncharacterized protein